MNILQKEVGKPGNDKNISTLFQIDNAILNTSQDAILNTSQDANKFNKYFIKKK